MAWHRTGIVGGILLALAAQGIGNETASQPAKATKKVIAALDPASLARRIDEHISNRWLTEKIEPAPAADDAEFMRRVYLDVTGRIPTVPEARALLASTAPDKRARLVDQLLDSPAYVAHFTN